MKKIQIKSAPLVKCHHCGGDGKIPLSLELWMTFETVRMLHGGSSKTIGISLDWKWTPTAINNRLEDLRKLGLVTRRRESRRWIYEVAK